MSHLELARALWASGQTGEARTELQAAQRNGEATADSLSVWLAVPEPSIPIEPPTSSSSPP